MTTYYISKNGSDSNNGLGPDASHASNKPWLTIGKALGASGISSGDTVYIGPGVYRESVTVAMTSAVAETKLLGDPGNAQGFKDGSGVLVAPADVRWTCYNTNDTTAPASTNVLTLSGRDFLTLQYMTLVGVILATTTNSVNITICDCVLVASNTGADYITYTGLADIASNWLLDRCIFHGVGSRIALTLPTSTTADYDTNFVIQNCMNFGAVQSFVNVTASGANSFKAGGVDILNCFHQAGATIITIASANISTSIPCTVYNSISLGGGISANASGQIVEDYNFIYAGTPRTNVSTGTNSVSTNAYSLVFEVGQSIFAGRTTRPFMTPASGSPFLGFGNQAGAPSVDLLNITRPAGGASTSNSIGALERHNTAAQETSTVHGGSSGLVLTGPGDQSFQVAVSAASTTIAVYARYDSTHAATNKPQMLVTNGGECGVNDATATMTSAADTWEQLSLSFTPARAGIVTVRFVSRSAAGGGKAFFDDFSVT